MKGWKEVELGDCIDFLNGFAFKSNRFSEDSSDIALVKGENLSKGFIDWEKSKYWNKNDADKYSKFLLRENDIVLAMDRPWVGGGIKYAMIKKNDPQSFLVQRVGCIRANKIADQQFLKFIIASESFSLFIKNIMGGVAVPHISPSQIKSFKFNLPPLPIQRRIAAILSAYDDLIENNLRRIKLLEELAQRTYEEWFVWFRFPGFEASNINSDWLPEGWERKKLGEVLELVYGKALKADERDGGRFPVFGSSGIVGGHSKAIAKGPGVILGRKGNVGSVFWSDTDFFPIDTVYYVNSDLSKYFIFYLLKSITFINNDAAVPGLNRNAAYMMESIIPSEKVISKFDDFVTSLFSQIEKLNNQNRLLKESRDILLPRLMSGEIELDELDGLEEGILMAAEPKGEYKKIDSDGN